MSGVRILYMTYKLPTPIKSVTKYLANSPVILGKLCFPVVVT